MSPRTTPSEITARIRELANQAEAAAGLASDPARPLAEALHLAADLLDQQQQFLRDLRNCKADDLGGIF